MKIEYHLLKILERYPVLEVIIRKIYWSSNFLIRFKNREGKTPSNAEADLFYIKDLFLKLQEIGIKDDDLLIVHSSYGQLKSNLRNLNGPKEIIDGLLKLIGQGGTLAFPTHPKYSDELVTKDYIKDLSISGVTQYDVQHTEAWTGALPNTFLEYPNVMRSRHPINSLAAVGPLAHDMIKDNILGRKPLACGENSSWKFCSDRHAKILGLGIDLVHALTMIHVAEDNDPINYPPEKWYRDRLFRVVDGDFSEEIVVGERKPKWAIHYTERRFRRDLLEFGIIKTVRINEFKIDYITDSQDLVKYLQSKNHSGYPYYMIKNQLI